MKRGEIWAARDSGYATKARSAVVVQTDDVSGVFGSVVLVGLTTFHMPGAKTRVKVDPTAANSPRAGVRPWSGSGGIKFAAHQGAWQ
ncbi:MAG: type II toxin-antitoxin system PemK/MazF family toxin, partial [Bifidobacteriaceae bacterium]|nr:type II toxin-antitoxin system PemK/MazF family toxin [Bifidobacteriaceae bacterium]